MRQDNTVLGKSNLEKRNLNAATQRLIWGVIAFSIGALLWPTMTQGPLDELALIRNAQLAEGIVYETDEVSGEGWWSLRYSFTLSTRKRKFSGSAYFPGEVPEHLARQNLPQPAVIEYLPRKPSLNRLQGTGLRSVTGWAKEYVFGGLFLLSVFGLSICLVMTGGRFLWRYPVNPVPALAHNVGKVLLGAVLLLVAFVLIHWLTKFYERVGVEGDPTGYAILSLFALCAFLPYPTVLILNSIGARLKIGNVRTEPLSDTLAAGPSNPADLPTQVGGQGARDSKPMQLVPRAAPVPRDEVVEEVLRLLREKQRENQ